MGNPATPAQTALAWADLAVQDWPDDVLAAELRRHRQGARDVTARAADDEARRRAPL